MDHKISLDDFKEYIHEYIIASRTGVIHESKRLYIIVDVIQNKHWFEVRYKTDGEIVTAVSFTFRHAIERYNSIP